MNDLISRNALLAEYDRQHEGTPGRARKLIEDAPSVDIKEAVKCKDCECRRILFFKHNGAVATRLCDKWSEQSKG